MTFEPAAPRNVQPAVTGPVRMTSVSPPPMWQAWLSVAVGAAGVYASLWFAAKVFRIGLLMYGKPPTFGTLVRWARMS